MMAPAPLRLGEDAAAPGLHACDQASPSILRPAGILDAPAIHGLIRPHAEAGHLLPRTLKDVELKAGRFIVAEQSGTIVGCAELASLSPTLGEVRSLVVEARYRGLGLGTRLIRSLLDRAPCGGFAHVCALTHAPEPFVRLGFSIVPHATLKEKIAFDCSSCPLFPQCGQVALLWSVPPTAGPAWPTEDLGRSPATGDAPSHRTVPNGRT